MNVITLRMALAKNRMKAADLRRATANDGESQISFDTINKVLDGMPSDQSDQSVTLATLRRIERAVPGIRLRVEFVEDEETTTD